MYRNYVPHSPVAPTPMQVCSYQQIANLLVANHEGKGVTVDHFYALYGQTRCYRCGTYNPRYWPPDEVSAIGERCMQIRAGQSVAAIPPVQVQHPPQSVFPPPSFPHHPPQSVFQPPPSGVRSIFTHPPSIQNPNRPWGNHR